MPANQSTLQQYRQKYQQFILIISITIIISGLLSACATTSNRNIDQSKRNSIVSTAMQLQGRPYRYGGNTPRGFDCSGLVQYSFAQSNIQTPRTTYQQYRASKTVYKRELLPGDLVFFRISSSFVSHVGIYIGNGQFIHSPRTGDVVKIDQLDSPYWQKHFVAGGTLLD